MTHPALESTITICPLLEFLSLAGLIEISFFFAPFIKEQMRDLDLFKFYGKE
jgi:hypothetical protein